MLHTTLFASAFLAAAPLTAPAFEAGGLAWHEGGLESALEAAQKSDTHVLLYFWRDGSEHCAALYQETLAADAAAEAVGPMVCLSANYDHPDGAKLFERFGVTTLPTVLFVDSEGAADDALLGYVDSQTFSTELARIRRGEGTRSALEATLESAKVGSEEAIEACFALAGKNLDLGDSEAHDACLAALRETHDPKARTVIGARAHLWAIEAEIGQQLAECNCGEEGSEEGHCTREASVVKADLKPLYAHAKHMKLAEARFEAWNTVANYEARALRTDLAVKAFARASKDVTDAQLIPWSKGIVSWTLSAEEPTTKQTGFALKCASRAADAAEALESGSELCQEVTGGHSLELVQAETLVTLAFAQNMAGMERAAKASAERALALAGDHADMFREALARVLES